MCRPNIFAFLASFALCGIASSADYGANMIVCLDLDPSKHPELSYPIFAWAEFAPDGTNMNNIDGGRGTTFVGVDENPTKGRYCGGNPIWTATIDKGHGVEAVLLTGPFGSHQPGLAIDSYDDPSGELWMASIFGDHGNVVVCKDPTSNNCDYVTQTDYWHDLATIALVWQPDGVIHSLDEPIVPIFVSANRTYVKHIDTDPPHLTVQELK